MIQGILDYLLIKAHFILLTEEKILKNVETEEYLQIYCDKICEILSHDNFFYTNPEFMKKIEAILYHKRFEGRHNHKLAMDFNDMIEAVRKYKDLTIEEKQEIIHDWIRIEGENRNIPFGKFLKPSLSTVYECIKADSYYAILLLQNNQYIMENPFFLLSTINLLTTVYPAILISLDSDTEEEKQTKIEGLLKCYASVGIVEDMIKDNKNPSFSKFILKKYLKTTRTNVEKVMECAKIKLEEESIQLKKTKN